MKTVTCKDGKMVFLDGEKSVELLDLLNLAANKSKYPMQVLSNGEGNIPQLLSDMTEKHKEIGGRDDEVFAAYLLDIIMISHLIRSSRPFKVLEIGATDGILSYHLAAVMGKLNRESLLCCVSNVIGNSSANHWLDRISMVEEPPNLSMLASDYESTQLETGNFDIVVVNGAVRFDKPYETIREAERLVKKNGVLLCYVKNMPLLESSFKLIFSERQEFEISSREMILMTDNPGDSWKQDRLPALEEEVSKLFQELLQVSEKCSRSEDVRPLLHKTDLCVDLAVKYGDIHRKTQLLQYKNMVLDYMLNIGKEFEEYYRNVLVDALKQECSMK